MRTHAGLEDSLRLSGLQLPEVCEDDASPGCIAAFSLCQTTTYRWSLTEDLVQYARSGIGSVGLYRPKVEEFDEDLAVDLIRSSNLSVSSLSWIGGFTGSDGNPQAEAMYDAREAMRFANAVDAGTIAIVTGGLGRHIGKQARRLMHDALRELCDEAEMRDLRLALHPFSNPEMKSRTLIRSIRETLAVINELERAPLGLMLDLEELADDPDLSGALEQIAPLIHCVRIRDRRPRHGRRRLRLGERALGQAALIRELLAAGYDGPFEFDLFSEQDRPVEQYEALIRECRLEFELFHSAIGLCS